MDNSRGNDSIGKVGMNTLTGCLGDSVSIGFVENFQVKTGGLCTSKDVCYPADQLEVVNFYRFEGESDPADSSILYLIKTNDGIMGTLVDAYGTYADQNINIFMKGVKGIHKILN